MKLEIDTQVTAKVCPTKVTVSGTFQGYGLKDQEDPTSVYGKVLHVKDGMQHLDWVYVDSIKVCDSEDKDERIRKDIMGLIQFALEDGSAVSPGSNTTKEEALAYLEKQKEQKPELKKVNDLRTWLNIVSKVLTEFQGIGQYLDNPTCQEIANMLREKYCFDDASSNWDRVYRNGLDAGEIYGYNKAKKEQKSAEWSEEDDALLRDIVSFFKDGTVKLQHDLNLYAGFLEKKFKFLRPKPHWKPSEEQIIALARATNRCVGVDDAKILIKLLEQLESL